jgi:hypothetical protein
MVGRTETRRPTTNAPRLDPLHPFPSTLASFCSPYTITGLGGRKEGREIEREEVYGMRLRGSLGVGRGSRMNCV